MRVVKRDKIDKGRANAPPTFFSKARSGARAQQKNMPIVMYLGLDVKGYEKDSERIITEAIAEGRVLCELCLRPMSRHSKYERGVKETGQRITITMVRCSACNKWHALLPDFLLPYKHYSGNEVEGVIIDSGSVPVIEIETEASEPTARRWIKQVGERVRQAVGRLKYLFGRGGQPVSETAIEAGHCYSELEQCLEMAPKAIKYSGNKLGLANIWLGKNEAAAYI